MSRKRIGLILITIFIAVFACVGNWFVITNIINSEREVALDDFKATASALVDNAAEDSDLGDIDLYFGNAEVFILNKETKEVLFNSHEVKIGPELLDAFEGKGEIATMESIRLDIDSERELFLFAPERTVYASVYNTEKFFVILIAVELLSYVAFVYLVFASSKRSVEKTLLEERLKKAEEADAAKALFISNMSHDIRTTMSSSIGFTDLAKKSIDDPNRAKQYLRKVQLSNDHLLTLVNDIVDVNRIENGTVTITESPTDVFKVVKGIEGIFKPLFEERGIVFSTDCSNVINEKILCDRVHVNQIVFNLLTNALKFTLNGGQVKFMVSQKTEPLNGVATYEIRVRDTGIGISNDFIQHIYEPFAREKIEAVNKVQGAGLGLTITKHLVDIMGGKIAVKSEPGVGTEFVLLFNFKLSSEDVKVESVEGPKVISANRFKGKKLLLVEDNDLNRDLAKDMLEEYGFIVNDVNDGTVAVSVMEKAEVGEYAAILMDIQMPNMDGYEATRKIRGMIKPQIASTPIVAMTANAFDEDRQKSMNAGMNAHIAKPVEMDKLLTVLEKYI